VYNFLLRGVGAVRRPRVPGGRGGPGGMGPSVRWNARRRRWSI